MLLRPDGVPGLIEELNRSRVVAIDTETYGPTTVWERKKKDRLFVEALTARPACITMATAEGTHYIPTVSEHDTCIPLEDVERILAACYDKHVVIHNAMYDIRVIENLLGHQWRPRKLFDTMIISWLTDMGAPTKKGKKKSNGLKELTAYHFGYEMGSFEDVAWIDDQLELFETKKKKKKGRLRQANEIPYAEIGRYADEDAYYTLRLYEILVPKLREVGYYANYARVEVPFLYTLLDMQYTGILFDASLIAEIQRGAETDVAELEAQWNEKAKCKIGSTKEIINTLYKNGIWDAALVPTTKGGQPACSVKALDGMYKLLPEVSLGRELIDIKKKHSQANKILTTYTHSLVGQLPYRHDGRIRSNFFQTGTNTGRLSSRGPNLQNQPAPRPGVTPIRQAYIAPEEHCLIAADYGTLEVRTMAHWSEDPMLTTFLLDGRDMHQYVADQIKKPRSAAKAAFFAWCYGGRARTVASSLRIPLEEAEALINGLDEIYQGVTAWRKKISEDCYRDGYVSTLLGRRRYLPGIYSMDEFERNPKKFFPRAKTAINTDPAMRMKLEKKGIDTGSQRALEFAARSIAMRQKMGAERQAANTPIQGTAADIAKLAGNALSREIRQLSWEYKLRIILQVHDEYNFECHDKIVTEAEECIKNIMENVVTLRIPLIVSVGHGKTLYDCK